MGQKQVQELKQTQQQKQVQSITQQQLLQAQLTELPITQLLERINTEMDDNPALEPATDESAESFSDSDLPSSDESAESFSDSDYQEDQRQSALDEALASIGRDDEELPVYYGGSQNGEQREEMVYGQTESFFDMLNEQMNMADLTEQERYVMEYLIGSLDDDGLLRKSLEAISDELAIYHNIDITPDSIEHVLHQLQEFDPAGIGARSLQECLLIQVKRREPSHLRDLMERTLQQHFELFTHKHWRQLGQALNLSELQTQALIGELRKLNPKPGASISETVGRSLQQITPDFIIDTHDDGTVTFSLNHGEVPELHVSQSFTDTLQEYQENKDNKSRHMK